jgi:hypothetical protein
VKPIIDVIPDLAGGLVLSTTDQWLMQDVAESVVRTIGAAKLNALRLALDGFDESNIETTFALDDARYEIAKGQLLTDRIVLARLLPHEIVALIFKLERALAAQSVAM